MVTGEKLVHESVDGFKYVYIKNGDVVEQLERIGSDPKKMPSGGPDAFVADFLRMVAGQPTLLMSRGARDAKLQIGNVDARVFDLCPTSNTFSRAFRRTWIFFAVLIKMIRFRPDRIVCGRLGSMLWASYVVSRLYAIPFIHSRHVCVDSGRESLVKRAMSSIDHRVIRRASAVVCHGPYTRQRLLEDGLPESKVIEFDVAYPDLASKSKISTPSSIADQEDAKTAQVVLYLGRLYVDKGVFDLFDACTPLLCADRRLKLMYVGDGPAYTELKERIEKKQLQEQVILRGRIPHEEVGDILRQCRLVVTPTRQANEGRCMSAMEALALGVPVIAPNGGPFPYLIESGTNGLLYTVDSIEDLQDAISTALKDQDLYGKLQQGALESGKKLRESVATFSEAVETGFAQLAPRR